ncbi:acyl carrier protein [Nocardia sp. SYP-A9097]|uniref:acyl carrier protein n=1 Tax=Nocardia sp. SYP-A9097 TaxID=2663237 RepID=UPI0013258D98|nr:phosphopantetheine-binding protein [Nocardia sp. SYP-A9097]MRH92350.1 acyl carrier protein [Nocardia sp. SYP-A9097]
MNTIDDFVAIVRDEIGLAAVTPEHATGSLDTVPGWDSIHLLSVIATMEARTGRSVPLPELLEAASLEQIYEMYTG